MSSKKVPQLPNTIRVGYRTWTLGEMDKIEHTKTGNWGVSSLTHGAVTVHFLGDAVEDTNTLIHELLHCCYRTMDIDDEDNEESTVTKLANGLTQVWRDNPKLIKYIDHALGAGK